MPARRESAFQSQIPFPDGDIPPSPPAPITGQTDLVGTVCQREILRQFPSVGFSILRQELRKKMAALGHALSTVDRSIGRLVSHGTLRSDCGSLILTDRDPPKPVNLAYSRPGKQSNRFGQQSEEDVVDMVRDLLAHRLDQCWERPNGLLRKVLVAVEWAGRIARAVAAGDPNGTRRAIREYQDHWGDRELTADDLLEAVQIGLFPETFAEDPRVREGIERWMAESQRRRDNWLAAAVETPPEDGDAPPPPGPAYRGGLIPFNGPPRCGRSRLRVWLDAVST